MESVRVRSSRSRTPVSNNNLNQEAATKQTRAKQRTAKTALPKTSKTENINIAGETMEIKSPYFSDSAIVIDSNNKVESSTKKKRQAKAVTDVTIKPEKVSKLKAESKPKTPKKKSEPEVCDIEEGGWKPDNWRAVLDNILAMRKLYVAPVDTLGCEECPEEGVLPIVERYQTLISVMLSSQTRDEVTYAAVQRLIEHGLTIDNILSTPDEKIGQLIHPVGFWKTKIKFIKNTTQILKDKYDGDIPRTYNELIKLPGVGPKIAHLVMSCAWKETVGIAVDTHVHRISNRLGWVPKPTKTPEQTRMALESWLPKDLWKPINFTLVGFGQSLCKPIGPSCEVCLNKNLCPFGLKSSAKHKGKSKK